MNEIPTTEYADAWDAVSYLVPPYFLLAVVLVIIGRHAPSLWNALVLTLFCTVVFVVGATEVPIKGEWLLGLGTLALAPVSVAPQLIRSLGEWRYERRIRALEGPLREEQ